MKKTIVAMITMILLLMPVTALADEQNSVWLDTSVENKEVSVDVVTDGSTTSGVLSFTYDNTVFVCEESDVKPVDDTNLMYAVNVLDNGTVKISYIAEKTVADGAMFTITLEASTTDIPATAMESLKLTGEAYTSEGKSVEVGTAKAEDTETEEPGDTETEKPGDTETEKPGDTETEKPGDSEADKPQDPKPESGTIDKEGSSITKEDVEAAKNNKHKEIKLENNKEVVVITNAMISDMKIKGETSVLDEDAFFVRKYITEGEIFDKVEDTLVDKLKKVDEFKVLEIDLYNGDGEKITALDGYVYVTIPVPADIVVNEGNVLVVYRLNEDGSYTNCDASIANGEITFRTNHFSTFVIAEQAKDAVVANTGDNTPVGLLAAVMAVSAVAAAVVLFKKKADNK